MRGQPLRLLGLLLVQRGSPVSAESAIEALWADGLPAHPANALQLVVTRLRRTVGADTVVTDAEGYALQLRGPEAIDADRFDRLAAEGEAALAHGQPAAAAQLLQSALGLWRGPALYGVRYESYAAAEIARLDERRLACLGRWIDAQLSLGRSERVVDELAALVAEHPLRESFRLQLVRALRDSGRGAEALAAYRGAAGDLGLPDLAAEPLRRARRQVVCVAVDVRPSADGEPLDLEARDDVMAFCALEAETILLRHDDAVIERVPEGLIAVFGARETHEDQALRAVRAATALQRRLAEIAREVGVQLELRVGLTAGTALVMAPDGLPSGEVVAAATQAARTARAGELALSAPVRALLRSSRTRPADASPLAGRDRELDRLHGSIAEVQRARSASLMLLLGEPGIGKSRLVREVMTRSGMQARVLVGRCPAYGDGVTYWPLREIVMQVRRGRPLAALFDPTEEGLAAAAVIAATLGLGGHAPVEAAPWAFRMLLEALARDRPLLLALDDAHWAEPPLLDLVDELLHVAAPVLVLCVGRPELLSARPAWASAARIQLAPVDAAASRRLLAGQSTLGEATVGRIITRARGNPLFLEQLAAHVAESGEEDGLPPALHALIAARLDALSATQRRLIEAAAVEGEVFHLGGLAALVPDIGRRESEGSLEELVRRELLLPAESLIEGERAFGFRHALVREAAYATVPLTTRADAHQRLAAWLGGLGAAVPEASARVAAQLERAHGAGRALRMPPQRLDELARRAAERLSGAAREVHRRGDLPSEIAFLDRALALLEPHDGARAELLPALGAALFEAGSLDRAAEAADAAVVAGRESGREWVRWRGEVERARLHAFRHPESVDPGASLVVAERAATALEELADALGVARARYLICELLWLQGRSERALRNAREVVRLARLAEDAVEVDAGVSYVAWALVVTRTPVSVARAECEVLLREVGGRRYADLGLRGFAAVLDAMEGRFDAARAQLARSRAGLADLGLQQASIWMATFAAYAEMLAGDPAAAAATLDEAERIAHDIGDRWFLSTILVDRAHVLLADERFADEAAAGVARIEECPAPNDAEWVIKRHAARGKLAALEGDAERALSEARAAVELADATEMFLFRADAARDLAEVAQRVGAREDAARARADALELYREKGNLAAAAQLARPPSR